MTPNTPAVVSLSPEQQRGWVTIGEWKKQLADRHQLKTLELQKLLLEPGTTIVDIENTLTSYRKVHSEMVKDGQTFRGIINDKVLQPSLDTEKEYSPKVNENYLLAEKKLTTKKLEAETANKATQAKNQERADYIAHVKNQYIILENDLKTRAITEINTMYISYLKTAVPHPNTDEIKKAILDMKLAAPVKFDAKYLTDEEKKAASADIPKPDFNAIRREMAAHVDEKFQSYQHDLAAGTVEQVASDAEQEIADIAKETQIETAVNVMTAQSTVPVIEPEGKKLKRTLEVVVEGTKTWAMYVDMAFWKTPAVADYIAVKEWQNLTVKQKATALGKYASETGEVDSTLTYREAVK